jgi:hypothetical protein
LAAHWPSFVVIPQRAHRWLHAFAEGTVAHFTLKSKLVARPLRVLGIYDLVAVIEAKDEMNAVFAKLG